MKRSEEPALPPEFSKVLASSDLAQQWYFSIPKEKRTEILNGTKGLSAGEFIAYLNSQFGPSRE